MKIINCFPYWEDRFLLERRINELKDTVDEFVIVETDRTWLGKPKPFYLEKIIEQLNIDKDKIRILKVNLPRRTNSYGELVRDVFASYIDENTIAFITDEHEIPNSKYIKYYATIAQENLYGLLRIPMSCEPNKENEKLWAYSFVCLKSHLENYTVTQLRYLDDKSENLINLFLKDNGVIEKAGWCYVDKQNVNFVHKQNKNTKFTFVHIGSNQADNNVLKYIYDHNIDYDLGIVVEPNALHHPLIKKNYHQNPKINIIHKAIVPSNIIDSKINFYYQTKDLPRYSLSSANIDFLIDQVRLNDHLKGGEIKAFKVDCSTLEDLLDDFNLHDLSWLILNTAGLDEDIVINFPWSRYNIKRIEIKNYWCYDKPNIIKSIFLDIGYQQSLSLDDSYWSFTKNP